jgi:hypothetical protein
LAQDNPRMNAVGSPLSLFSKIVLNSVAVPTDQASKKTCDSSIGQCVTYSTCVDRVEKLPPKRFSASNCLATEEADCLSSLAHLGMADEVRSKSFPSIPLNFIVRMLILL